MNKLSERLQTKASTLEKFHIHVPKTSRGIMSEQKPNYRSSNSDRNRSRYDQYYRYLSSHRYHTSRPNFDAESSRDRCYPHCGERSSSYNISSFGHDKSPYSSAP